MSAVKVDDARQQTKQRDPRLERGDLLDLIWNGETRKLPEPWPSIVELLYLDFENDYLDRDEWLACIRATALSPDPSKQQATKEQLMAPYLLANCSNKECENFADAWIHAARAREAVVKGHGDAVQTHVDSAYTFLAANKKTQLHGNLLRMKARARQECVDEFAKLVQAKRPAGGWTDDSHVARELQQALAIIIEKKKREYGPLWKNNSGVLIIDWLAKKKGPVYEAYRGRGS